MYILRVGMSVGYNECCFLVFLVTMVLIVFNFVLEWRRQWQRILIIIANKGSMVSEDMSFTLFYETAYEMWWYVGLHGKYLDIILNICEYYRFQLFVSSIIDNKIKIIQGHTVFVQEHFKRCLLTLW